MGEDTVEVDSTMTLTLQIGKWFKASKLLVEDISNIEFSKEIIAPFPVWGHHYDEEAAGFTVYNGTRRMNESNLEWGFPLYTKCTITLRPVTLITIDEFLEYFPELSTSTSLEVSAIAKEEGTGKVIGSTDNSNSNNSQSSSSVNNNTLNPPVGSP
jgi:hypothetical protein